MKILVTGAAGMLGHDLVVSLRSFGTVVGVDVMDFDICDEEQCWNSIRKIQPDWIINSAAYTAVDRCETDIEGSFAVNAEGAANLAQVARKINARFVHISTDYVFAGDAEEPYKENDIPQPATQYGLSKLDGERRIHDILEGQGLIVRTAWLFGVHGKNFIDTMIDLAGKNDHLRVVDDQIGSPTFTGDLAVAVRNLMTAQASGIVHVTNDGTTSWYGFASYFLKKTFPGVTVVPVATEEFPRAAPRPKYSVLSNKRYQTITGCIPPHWKDAVDRYLNIRYLDILKE